MPTHVRTPEGAEMPLLGDALAAEVERRHGAPVQMMRFKHGIFDEASISLIACATVDEIGRLSNTNADIRRFRPNLVIRSTRHAPFEEDQWVGSTLTFGESDDAPAISITRRDRRCTMINIDQDSTSQTPEVMNACIKANDNFAGVYATVTHVGQLTIGQPILLHRQRC